MGCRLLIIFLALYVSYADCTKTPSAVDWKAEASPALKAKLKKAVLLEVNMRYKKFELSQPPKDMEQIGYGKTTTEPDKENKIPKREAHVVKFKFQVPNTPNTDYFCYAAFSEILINGKVELVILDFPDPECDEKKIHDKANACPSKILFWYEAVVGSFTATQQLAPLVKANMLKRIRQINSTIEKLTKTDQAKVNDNLPDFPLIEQFQTSVTHNLPGGKPNTLKITIFQILEKGCDFLKEDLYFAALECSENSGIPLKVTQFFHSPQFLLTNGQMQYIEEISPMSGEDTFSLYWMDFDTAKTFPAFAPFFTVGAKDNTVQWEKAVQVAVGKAFQDAQRDCKRVGLRYRGDEIVPYFVVQIVINIGIDKRVFLSLPMQTDENEAAAEPRMLATEKMALDWAAY